MAIFTQFSDEAHCYSSFENFIFFHLDFLSRHRRIFDALMYSGAIYYEMPYQDVIVQTAYKNRNVSEELE